MHPLTRLSDSFILLDFLYDYDNYTKGKFYQVGTLHPEVFNRGKVFCEKFLEPLIEQYGAMSIAAGLCWGTVGPHNWSSKEGCAVDIIFHDWVNKNKSPASLMYDIDNADIVYERMITYGGSEAMCMAYKPDGGNRYAMYENIRVPGQVKPTFKAYGKFDGDRNKRLAEQYTIPDRANWRREKNEPVYATRRSIRPQHMRVSEYFVFLDFCKNYKAINSYICTIPPVSIYTNENSCQFLWARRFGEVLDRVVKEFGRVSVIEGMQPKHMSPCYTAGRRWVKDGKQHVTFIPSITYEVDGLLDYLEELQGTYPISFICEELNAEDTKITLTIEEPFEPAKRWVSYVL